MSASLTSDWTVREILQTCPETARVFFHLKTDCVGCWLQQFCTIKDVCGAYTLDMDDLINKLQKSSGSQFKRRTQ
jgi:hybrid cluster-associated redox disulfide protein